MREINDREFGVIVPRYDNKGNKIKDELIAKEAKRMARQFGGANVDKIFGCWKEEDKPDASVTCEENVTITAVRDSEEPPTWLLCQKQAVEEDKDPRSEEFTCKYSFEDQIRDDEGYMKERRKQIQNRLSQAAVFTTVDETEAVLSEYDPELEGKPAKITNIKNAIQGWL